MDTELLDGFTVEQWAAYAKLKAGIATRICRENGSLKQQLASFARRDYTDGQFNEDHGKRGYAAHDLMENAAEEPTAAADYKTLGKQNGNIVDYLYETDPWATVSPPSSTCPSRPTSVIHPWANWTSATPYAASTAIETMVPVQTAETSASQSLAADAAECCAGTQHPSLAKSVDMPSGLQVQETVVPDSTITMDDLKTIMEPIMARLRRN